MNERSGLHFVASLCAREPLAERLVEVVEAERRVDCVQQRRNAWFPREVAHRCAPSDDLSKLLGTIDETTLRLSRPSTFDHDPPCTQAAATKIGKRLDSRITIAIKDRLLPIMTTYALPLKLECK